MTHWRHVLAAALIALGFSGWLLGAAFSPVLDWRDAAERSFAASVAALRGNDMAAERALAEAYWQRYEDVARDGVYGRNGRLGVFGAREHWLRHGKAEDRLWQEW